MTTQRILVKAPPGLTQVHLTFGAAPVTFEATKLFSSIAPTPALGAAAASIWHILTPPPGFAAENPWDACHSLLQQGFGIAGAGAPEFAEPDLEQRWIAGHDAEFGLALSQSCDAVDGQSEDFPRIPENPYWFRDSGHSQFDDAVAAVGGPNVAAKVRIAHFDTGYDPEHRTLPKRLRTD